MAQEMEIEFKNLLTEQEYERLKSNLNLADIKPSTHTNHYFETKDFALKAKGVALRIREKNHQWQLTLKEPYQDGLLETHDTLSELEAMSWMAGNIVPQPLVAGQLNKLGIDFAMLKYGGALTTERIETTYQDAVVVLDKSSYNGQVDYELEVEARTKETGEKVFEEILENNDITRKETPNKIGRFYSSLT